MPRIRVTWFFIQNANGWTETLWQDGTSTDLLTYDTVADNYAQKRIACSGVETKLFAYRVSIDGVFRDARNFFYPGAGLAGPSNRTSDAPTTCLLTAMRKADRSKSRMTYVRGIWDNIIDLGGKYTPIAAFTANWNAWRAQIIADNWGWYGVDTRTPVNITAVTQAASGQVNITVDAAAAAGPFPQKAKVSISGILGASAVNGVQIGTFTDATHFITKRRISIFPYVTGGRLTSTTNAFIAIGSVTDAPRVGERKCGRPGFVSRGRRSVARAG